MKQLLLAIALTISDIVNAAHLEAALTMRAPAQLAAVTWVALLELLPIVAELEPGAKPCRASELILLAKRHMHDSVHAAWHDA